MSPVTGGAAEKAGVRKGDRLVWMDGAAVSELTHSALSRMVHMNLSLQCCCFIIMQNSYNFQMLIKTARRHANNTVTIFISNNK